MTDYSNQGDAMAKPVASIVDPLRPLNADFLENPYPTFDRLRKEAPVFWSEKGKYWLISRYEEANAILRNLGYGKELQHWRQFNPLLRLGMEMIPAIKSKMGWMLNQDPPDHTRLRSLVNRAFTPAMVARLRPHIQKIADSLIDGFAAQGSCDLVADYAFQLPVTVIAEMLGIPAADRERFKAWSHAMTEALEPSFNIAHMGASNKANDELIEYLKPLVEQRRRSPQDDLISALVRAEEEGSKLTEEELLGNCVLLLVAGHETTVNLIGNSIYLLLTHPESLLLLRQKPDLIDSAVNEFLRYESPVQMMRRLASADLEVNGQQIKKGDMLIILIGSANRDPAQFENPDVFDITRIENKHISFGLGIHHCLGSSLAEAEGQIAVSTLINRLPNLKLTGAKLEHRLPFALRGMKVLPVEF
jgi:cytochrome P450